MEASLSVSITNATCAIVLTLVLPIVYQLANGRFLRIRAATDSEVTGTSATAVRFSILTIRFAIFFYLVNHLGFAMAESAVLFTLSGVIAAAAAPVSPTIQSLMTTSVEADRYGEVLGAIGLFHALARSLIPDFIQFIYSVTFGNDAETVFWVLCLLFGGTFVLSLQIRPRQFYRHKNSSSTLDMNL